LRRLRLAVDGFFDHHYRDRRNQISNIRGSRPFDLKVRLGSLEPGAEPDTHRRVAAVLAYLRDPGL
jgi:hypothetical protein